MPKKTGGFSRNLVTPRGDKKEAPTETVKSEAPPPPPKPLITSDKKVLVLDCGAYAAGHLIDTLKNHNVSIGFENKIEKNGTTNWIDAFRDVSDYDVVIHWVSEPLLAIKRWLDWRNDVELAYAGEPAALIMTNTSCDEEQDPLEFAVRMWMDWTDLAAGKAALSVSPATISDKLTEICELLGVPADKTNITPAAKADFPITYAELPEAFHAKLAVMLSTYGYIM